MSAEMVIAVDKDPEQAIEREDVDMEANTSQQDAIKSQGIVSTPSKNFMGRDNKEWSAFLPCFGALPLIAFGAKYINGCPGIPSLAPYLLTFGILNIVSSAIPFVFRVEKLKAEKGDGGIPAKVMAVVGFSIVAVAIWGAVVTWGQTRRFGEELPDCKKNVYVPGFLSSVMCLGIIVVMLCKFMFLAAGKSFEALVHARI